MSHKQTIKGKSYNSKAQVANDYNMSPQQLNYRINEINMSIEDAIELPVKDMSTIIEEITIDGITYESFRAACKAYNRNHSTALSRIAAGMSKEDAIKKVSAREFPYEGKIYKDAKACCEHFNVSYQNVTYYSKKHGITKQEAITFYRNKNTAYP